jgi:hypothetical protein
MILPEQEDSFESRRHSRERREAHEARRLALGFRLMSEEEAADDALDKGRDRPDIYGLEERYGFDGGDEC